MKWGEGTSDEMCVAALFYTVDTEHLTRGVAVDAFAPPPGPGGKPRPELDVRERLAMGAFDKDGDGKLDAAERAAVLKFIAAHQGHDLSPDEPRDVWPVRRERRPAGEAGFGIPARDRRGTRDRGGEQQGRRQPLA